MVTTVIVTPPSKPPGTGGGATVGGGSRGPGDPGRKDGGGGDPSAAPNLGTITITAPSPAPTPPPPATPLGALLNRPLNLREPLTEFQRLLEKPLAEVKVRAKKRLRPLGRAAPSLFARLISPAFLVLFPSPIAEDKPLGQKFPFPKQKPSPAPASTPPPAQPPENLGTVTIEAPRDSSRPPKIGVPNLVALPIPGFGRARFLETKPARPPQSKRRPKVNFRTITFQPIPQLKRLERPVFELQPLPLPIPSPSPSPRPFPSPIAPPISPPGGKTVCTCRTVDPTKKKKKRKKKDLIQPAQLEVEYTQGKQKVKVEGKVEKLCVIKRVPIPKISSPGVKITTKGIKATGFRKSRVIRKCF